MHCQLDHLQSVNINIRKDLPRIKQHNYWSLFTHTFTITVYLLVYTSLYKQRLLKAILKMLRCKYTGLTRMEFVVK